MKWSVVMLICLLFLIPTFALAKQPIRTIEGIVTKVSDGDTINVTDDLGTKVKVRLYWIDAPETEKVNKDTGELSKPDQLYGSEAEKALQGKIGGRKVRLDALDLDKYKWLVSLVWLGSRNINQEMVAEGYAWAYRKYLERPYASEFLELEVEVRLQVVGLWKQDNCQLFGSSVKRRD